ncbi:MAG: hypothetical protein JXR55_00825 [Candidatus Fermentibacteraceae bacterium]|nr:hypothetical protein [Candidatus Fermentibacteraceae bacterium]
MPDRVVSLVLLLLLAGAVTVGGFSALCRSEYATGWDGYYYLVQVQSLSNTGEMHSPEYSLVYVPLLAFHALTGDYLASFRLSAVLIKLAFVLAVFSLSRAMVRQVRGSGREAFLTALTAAALSAASPSLNYFFTQFPKNLLGFALFLFFAASVMGTARYRREREPSSPGTGLLLRSSGAAALFLMAFFTHRYSAVLSTLFLVLYLVPVLLRRLRRMWDGDGRGHGRLLVSALVAAALLISVLFVADRLPLAPSVQDLERVTGDLSSEPILVPLAFVQGFGLFRLTVPWLAEIVLAAALPLATCILLLFGSRFRTFLAGRGYYALLLLSLVGLFPFLRFSLTGLSYRLFFGTMLLFPVVCVPYLNLATKKMLRVGRDGSETRSAGLPVLVYLCMLALSFWTGRSYRPLLHDPPYEYYQELSDEVAGALSGVECVLLIAHRSLAEMITFRHEMDALPWAPEEYFERDGVWRVTAGIMRDEFSYYIGPLMAERYFTRLRGDYGLIREDCWEAFLDSIAGDPVMMEAVDTWRNPMEQRPAYLVRNR